MKRPDWLSARKTPMGSGKPFQGRNKTRPIGCCPPPSAAPLLSCAQVRPLLAGLRVQAIPPTEYDHPDCWPIKFPATAAMHRLAAGNGLQRTNVERLSIGDSEPSSFIQTPSICLKEGHCALRCPACGTPGIRRTTRPYMPSGPVIRKQHKGIASASAVQTGEHRLLRLLKRTQTALETLMAGTESTFASRRSRPDRSFRGGKLLR